MKTKTESSLTHLVHRATAATGVILPCAPSHEHLSSRRRRRKTETGRSDEQQATRRLDDNPSTRRGDKRGFGRWGIKKEKKKEATDTNRLRPFFSPSRLRRPAVDTVCVSGLPGTVASCEIIEERTCYTQIGAAN